MVGNNKHPIQWLLLTFRRIGSNPIEVEVKLTTIPKSPVK